MSKKMGLTIRIDEIEIELEITFKEKDNGTYIVGIDMGENESLADETEPV